MKCNKNFSTVQVELFYKLLELFVSCKLEATMNFKIMITIVYALFNYNPNNNYFMKLEKQVFQFLSIISRCSFGKLWYYIN